MESKKGLEIATIAAALIGLGAFQPLTSAAQSVRYDLDTAASLTADGFVLEEAEPSMSFSGGQLRITTSLGFSEWILQTQADQAPAARGWLVPGSSARGWRIEARMQLLSRDCSGVNGPGLWVADGTTSFRLHFLAGSVLFDSMVDKSVAMNTTDAMHVYRLQSPKPRSVQLFVDDVMKLEVMLPPGVDRALMFGDLGGCSATDSVWDYVEYDSFGAGSTGDQDDDGIVDANDACVFIADPEQSDGDGDGIGDACDVCAMDADNDADNDGACAQDDVCPDDPRNDQDSDGVCDTLQCMAFPPGSGPPGAPGVTCPAVCRCPTWGVDLSGLDNFLPAGGTGGVSGSTGSGGATGSTGVGQGAKPASGAGGATGTGGATGSNPGSAGAPATTAEQSHTGGGCTLATGVTRSSNSAALFAALALLGVLRRRARSRARE